MSVFRRITNLFHRSKLEQEIEAELRAHIEMRTADNIAAGMSSEEARRDALLRFGNRAVLKERVTAVDAQMFLDSIWQDLCYALRMLRKSPGFTAVAVLTLALGIGANTAIFSVLEAQLWRPLPFPDSNRLVEVLRTGTAFPDHTSLFSAPDFPAWLAAQNTFSDVCAFRWSDYYNTPGTDTADLVTGKPISSSYFKTLRMPPTLGRGFLASEQQPGHDREAVLSYAFWQGHYASNPKIIGQTIVLDGSAYTIVGVASAALHVEPFGNSDLYIPLVLTDKNVGSRNATGLVVIGRLKRGSSERSAQAQMDVIATQLAQRYPQRDANLELKIKSLQGAFSPQHQGLFFFAGAAALVLLIACVNVATLLLARGLVRQHEFALRTALGASRRRLLRQLLVEGALLGALGGALGIFAALWSSNALNALMPADFMNPTAVPQMDTRVLLFAMAISFCAAILAALAPGFFASRVNLNGALHHGAPTTSGGSSHRRLRSVLVVAEVALAVTLLFGAGLFLNSFVRVRRAPLGFDPHSLISLGLTLSDERYSQPQNLWLGEQQILERVRAIPGVSDALFASQIPFAGGIDANFEIVGHPTLPNAEKPDTLFSTVSSNYFHLLRIPLLAGRSFDAEDSQESSRVVVVNQNFVDHYFRDRSPVGAELDVFGNGFGSLKGAFRVRIVGVVPNTQMFGANEFPFDFIYASSAQVSLTAFNNSVFLVVSSNLPPSAVLSPIRHQIAAVDKGIPVTHVATMDERVDESLKGDRGNLILIGIFAGLAAVLVAVGIFGAISYVVEQRTREFGIRLALGSSPAGVLRLALKYSAVLGVSGIVVGVAFSLVLGRVLGSALYLVPRQHDGLLYGVSVFDPLTLVSSCLFLAAVLFFASYIPARRAMRVDPMVALRYE